MTMTDAEKFFFAGGSHARAAHALLSASQTNVHMSVPFYLLVGFSLETVLKAAYVHLGGDMDFAKGMIGHNLPKALESARSQGFEPSNGELGTLIEIMADVHRNHSFRYLSGEGELRVAEETFTLKIVDDLVTQVGQLLYPEHGPDFWMERLKQFETTG